MINWSCQRCGEGLEAPDCLVGHELDCPICGRASIVPQVPVEADAVLIDSAVEAEAVAPVVEEPLAVPSGVLRSQPDVDLHIEDAAPPSTVNGQDHAAPAERDPFDVDYLWSEHASPEQPDDHHEPTPIELIGLAPSDRGVTTNGAHSDEELVIEALSNPIIIGADPSDTADEAVPPQESVEVDADASAVIVADDVAAAALAVAPARTDVALESDLARSLDALVPVIHHQLNPAVAQFAANAESNFSRLGRVTVDIFLRKMIVRSHCEDRVSLGLRYGRVRRRAILGHTPLANLEIEAVFVLRSGRWSLDRWQRVETL